MRMGILMIILDLIFMIPFMTGLLMLVTMVLLQMSMMECQDSRVMIRIEEMEKDLTMFRFEGWITMAMV